jgi:hypothetical protein
MSWPTSLMLGAMDEDRPHAERTRHPQSNPVYFQHGADKPGDATIVTRQT